MIEGLSMGVSTETVQLPTRVYRRELPGGGLILAPLTAVQPVKNTVAGTTGKDRPA